MSEPRTRTVSLSLPLNTAIERVVLVQEQDSNADPNQDLQRLTIDVQDAGGGAFLTLSTTRWAVDPEEMPALAALMKTLTEEKLP